MSPPVYVDFLNRFDIEALELSDCEILDAVNSGLEMQGRGETVIETENPYPPARRR